MSNYSKNQYAIYSEMLNRLQTEFISFAYFKIPHSKIIEILKTHIWETKEYEKLSTAYKNLLKGYSFCLHDKFRNENLIYVFEYKGKIVTRFDKLPKKERESYVGTEKRGYNVYKRDMTKKF